MTDDGRSRIEWGDSLAVGHAEIDRQHRQMVELFNALHRAVYGERVGEKQHRMLDALLELAAHNFRTEEALMQAHSADDGRFQQHRAIHRGMLQELRAMRERLFKQAGRLNVKALNFIRKWVYEHLVHFDRELVDLARCSSEAGVCRGLCRRVDADQRHARGIVTGCGHEHE